ncbi:MAG: ThuA domain-containing protein [Halieaceae bacterium]
MSIINYAAPRQLLVTARGHPYERDAFCGLFETLDDFSYSLVEQPAAQYLFNPGLKDRFDACVCYDMPGLNFTAEDPPGLVQPTEAFKSGLLDLLEAGMGFVFMHHSIAAWPAWPEYAEIVGGRFHYRPAELRGVTWPDSGYRHQVDHQVSVVAQHPVTEGLPESFRITDELYLCPVFEESVIPLIRSDYAFTDANFYSAQQAVAGTMFSREGWSHPPGCELVGWVKHYRNSPIVYLQGGDDPVAYDNEHFQRLLHNAIRWVASDEAHTWARQQK